MTEPLIEVIGVTRRFESRAETVVALDDVSFSIASGESVGLVGPSGSGKSTLLHLLVGWDTPDVGSIRRRQGLTTNWSSVSTIPQDLGLLPELTARENVALALRLGGGTGQSPSAVLDELEMGDLGDRRPHELSLGEQQRVAVARAVVGTPDLVVADEPTAHQDEARADAVLSVLVRVARSGGGVLVATHDERLLDRVDRVLQLVDGRLAAAT